MTRRKRQQGGFTLIEMMVALVLFAAITVGMMSVAVTMTNGYRDQEVTIATESATRSTLEFMSQGLRGGSPGVSNPNNVTDPRACGTAMNNSFRVEQNLTVSGLSSKPDAFTVVMPAGSVMTTTTSALVTNAVDVRNASELNIGDQVIVTDHNTGHIMRITGKTGNSLSFAAFNAACTSTLPTGGYPAGSVVMRAMRARFSIGFLTGETVPMLFMDADAEGDGYIAEPIAEGIEDMQIAVGVDTNGDGFITSDASPASPSNIDEWLGNVSSDTPYTNQLNVRAIRITLVARTSKAAMGNNTYKLPAIEDRAANASVDNFRRRILTSVIEVRNLGGSP